uniref:Translocase of inner mitochondrial membrane 23 homolog b (yeast) n=1 Tax=Petromyzon marinus TaxID=7757 RepID=S4R8Q7_PETMA
LSPVPAVSGMSPLSPYLNVDPRYLTQDYDELSLRVSTIRWRTAPIFTSSHGHCLYGASFGALNGLRLGFKETHGMKWAKPRNVQILNMVTRQGAVWANTLGSVALMYSAFGVAIEYGRGAEDDLNTMVAGSLTGMLYKSTSGLRGVAKGGVAGLTLSGLYALYNNWDRIKSSMWRQSI